MRGALSPRPGLAALPELLAQTRTAGLPVELSVEGEPPRSVAPGVELAAYRIVQEALTNARKHAGAARTSVALRYGNGALEIMVANDGTPVVRDGRPRGHGLVGMRERAACTEARSRPGRVPRADSSCGLGSRSRRTSRPSRRAVSKSACRRRRRTPRDGGRVRGHVFDALVVAVAVVSEIELWVASVPGPKLVLVPFLLLWTLPLLWRHRFPLGAPAFAFAMQAPFFCSRCGRQRTNGLRCSPADVLGGRRRKRPRRRSHGSRDRRRQYGGGYVPRRSHRRGRGSGSDSPGVSSQSSPTHCSSAPGAGRPWRSGPCGSSGSVSRTPAPRWPRSGGESRATSTT